METQLQAIKVFLWRSPTSCCHMLIQADLQVYNQLLFIQRWRKTPAMQSSGLWEVNVAVAEEESML